MSPIFKDEVAQVPVTALAQPWDDLIFVGQGPQIKVYDRISTGLILTFRAFASQAIHGFAHQIAQSASSLWLIAWGGRNVNVSKIFREQTSKSTTGFNLEVVYKSTIKISDWIFDASLRRRSDEVPLSVVLVTAHNDIFELQIVEPEHNRDEKKSSLKASLLFSGPRCGLYSAALKWLSPDHLLAISGTAFGEIVVWPLHIQHDSIEARRHHVFTGHEGSIFGVRVSDELIISDGTVLRLLASCSDDRTIRIWDISDLQEGVLLGKDEIDTTNRDSSRTTGFLNYVSEEAAAASETLCIASGMGHMSRIWDIRFAIERQLESSESYVCSIISVGEDATCQKWHLTSSALERQFKLTHILTNGVHSGKNLWSMSTTNTLLSHLAKPVTGGADGAVIEHSSLVTNGSETRSHIVVSEWDIDQVMGALDVEEEIEHDNTVVPFISISDISKKDSFRSFAAIGTSQLLLTTNNGLVLLATTNRANGWTWKKVAAFEGLKGYSVACHLVAEPFEYVLFGDARGNIYYYHSFFETAKHLTTVDGKITKLIAEILPPRTHEYMSIVVTRHGGQPPVQLRINLGFGGTIHLASTKSFAKWTPDFPQITSAVVAVHENTEKGLIIGCRNGTIYSYSRIESPGKREFDFELPSSHGKEAVTAMIWLPDKSYQENMWNPSFGWLFSVGRDGTLAIHHFEGIYRDPILVHRLSLSFGPSLEGITIAPESLDISVWGFTSKYFICQNVGAQEDVVTIECGGAHRIWNFAPFAIGVDGTTGSLFAWVKAMKLNLAQINGPNHRVIQSGSHGREIKTCAVASASLRPGLGPLIATGAEDTDIAISYFADWHGGKRQLKRLAVLRKHVTGVQSLHWSSDGNFLFSCGGFEQFYVWRLRSVPAVGVGIVCESKCPLEDSDIELRITDFAVLEVAMKARSSLDDDQWSFLISMVYSDSSIKVWKYTSTNSAVPDRQAWSFIAAAQYTTACLTTAAFLSPQLAGWPLVTGATDGCLSFWSLTETSRNLECIALRALHQNSIKALAAMEVTDSTWLVASGGDDNALGITILNMHDETSEFATSALIVPSAHAAAINAIALIADLDQGSRASTRKIYAVTASNDQVVKLWEVTLDSRKAGTKGISLRTIGRYSSSVADIAGLAVFRKDVQLKILVSGVGTEMWTVSN